MYICRIRLSDAPSAGSLLRLLGDTLGPYESHRLVWTLFGDDADRDRDFLYRIDLRHGRPEFVTVSARKPEDRHDLFRIEPKDYAPDLRAGDRLRIMARVNPVWRKEVGGKRRKVDVVMDEVHRRKAAGETSVDRLEAAQVAVPRWLDGEGARHGFRLLDAGAGGVTVETYGQSDFRTRTGQPVRLAGIDMTAAVEVTDAEAFTQMLFTGLGPSRAFGYGLVMARRI